VKTGRAARDEATPEDEGTAAADDGDRRRPSTSDEAGRGIETGGRTCCAAIQGAPQGC
jgi:hypothetical protein